MNGTRETVRQWLLRNGQAARLCELFWEPLALAALNQSIDQAEASHFMRVLGACSVPILPPRRWCCRPFRSTRCMRSRRARGSFIAAATCVSTRPQNW